MVEDQVLIDGVQRENDIQFNSVNSNFKKVIVHSYNQESKDRLSKIDLQGLFEGMKVETQMSQMI